MRVSFFCCCVSSHTIPNLKTQQITQYTCTAGKTDNCFVPGIQIGINRSDIILQHRPNQIDADEKQQRYTARPYLRWCFTR